MFEVKVAAQRGMAEILDDVRLGVVPPTVESFSELHDYVDANVYGGLCDEEDVDIDDANAVQDILDPWIREGGLVS